MKKPNVLNRSMFNRGETSAYGKGITSNLVSDKQRQRYNYGGRVRAAYGLPEYRSYTDRGQQYVTDYMPQSQEDWRKLQEIQMEGLPYKTIEEINEEVESFVPGEKPWYKIGSDWPKFGETTEDYTSRIAWEKSPEAKVARRNELLQERQSAIKDLDPDLIEKRKEVGLYTPGISADQPLHQEFGTPVVEEEKEEVISKGPMGDEMWGRTTVRDEPDKPIRTDTDELDTPDRWAFLDENMAKKKKLARGHALMEGAAAAADFAVAATPEKRGAAVSKGLRGVGTIGAKYKGEAEDIKTKAKILGTVEDIKGEQKQKLFEDRRKGYYEPSLKLQTEELELKKEIEERKAEKQDPLDIYTALNLKGELNSGQKLAKGLSGILRKKIHYAGDDNAAKDLGTNPENNGILYVDVNSEIWRNVNGVPTPVDEYQDTEFFGE